MDELTQGSYQLGRIEQHQWIVNELRVWVREHPDVITMTPLAFRDFLSDMAIRGMEVCHGTRPVDPVQVSA